MNFSGICEVLGCRQVALYIIWKENYCIYCENHRSSLTNQNDQLVYLTSLTLQNVEQFIKIRRESNRKNISNLYQQGKEASRNQEANLIHLQNWKIQVTNFVYKVYRSWSPKSLTDGIMTLVRLNYAKLELEGETALIPHEFREAIHLKQKLDDERLSILPELERNNFSVVKSLYFIPFNSFTISAQIISIGHWRLLMKSIESSIPENFSILKKEANHISSRKSSAAYESLVCTVETASRYSYITETGISETFIEENKTYSEKEVAHFLRFAAAIIEDCSNSSLNLNFLEPDMIGSFKGEYFLIDFKNSYSEYDRNYLAPEHFEAIQKGLSMLKFSSSLIALQMLKVDISGLNTQSCLPILYKKIGNLAVSEELKSYLKETLRSEHPGANLVQETQTLSNQMTGLNLNK